MSYNDIAYSFSQYPKITNKNYEQIKQSFQQAILKPNDESENPILMKRNKKSEIQK